MQTPSHIQQQGAAAGLKLEKHYYSGRALSRVHLQDQTVQQQHLAEPGFLFNSCPDFHICHRPPRKHTNSGFRRQMGQTLICYQVTLASEVNMVAFGLQRPPAVITLYCDLKTSSRKTSIRTSQRSDSSHSGHQITHCSQDGSDFRRRDGSVGKWRARILQLLRNGSAFVPVCSLWVMLS